MPEGAWVEPGLMTMEPEIKACPTCGDLFEGDGHVCTPPKSMAEADDRLDGSISTRVLAQMAMAPLALPGHLGTRQEIESELDAIARSIRTFHVKQPDQVMREAGAYSARLTELQVLLHRVESTDRQFKIASRLLEASRQDLELLR